MEDTTQIEGIAVIGMAGRFPQAANVEQFWQNLIKGKDCFTEFSIEHIVNEGISRETAESPTYVKRSPVLSDPGAFDNRLFKYSPREAELIDPQHRIMMECAWEALENSGHDPHRFPGLIGIWTGVGVNNYFIKNILSQGEFEEVADSQTIIANDKDYMASRIAYKLNLKGPAVVVQTACSTSLVAVNMACLSLLTYQCDMALAGAVFLQAPRARGYIYHEGEIFSPDGFVRAFDKGANGTVLGEGCGLVVLRRLEDAIQDHDNILAVIRGSAVNNDGSDRAGYTAPGVNGQVELITMAQTMAGVSPDEISYIEAHGTGTTLGDPIEVSALTQVFCKITDKKGFCGLGSVKNNIGHLDVAAGIAGLIKTICALKNKQIPPTINYTEPNPDIRIPESPFYVVDKLINWEARNGRRIAGVSSFGMGGTNAHAVIEEFTSRHVSEPSNRKLHIIPLSAATPDALNNLGANLSKYIGNNPAVTLPDISWTLAEGRQLLRYRRCVIADSLESAASRLAEPGPLFGVDGDSGHGSHPVIFLFSGQGTQYHRMGLELYKNEPLFRENMNNCSDLLGPIVGSSKLTEILYSEDEQLGKSINQTAVSQVALFAIEYSVTRLLESLGIRPSAVIGHSIGEYVAATEAGVFTFKDALKLVRERGRLMQSMETGAMVAIPRSEDEVRSILPEELDLAVVNGPNISVVSGTETNIDNFEKKLDSLNIKFRRLITSHAYHSRMMEPAAQAFKEIVKQVTANSPGLPLGANLTGGWMTPEQAADPGYWSSHIRNTVRFADNLKAISERFDSPVLLEIGPGNTLCSIVKQNSEDVSTLPSVPTIRHPQQNTSDHTFFYRAVGALWCHGAEVDLGLFYSSENRVRVPLPSYPFERNIFWIGAGAGEKHKNKRIGRGWVEKLKFKPVCSLFVKKKSDKAKQINDTEMKRIWSKALGLSSIGLDDNFFELGGHSLLAVSIITEIEKGFGIRLSLASLIEAPTIKRFMHLLDQKESGASSPYLITLNAAGNKPPFFMLHSHGGNILEYHPLANHIKEDRPVYAIQCRGLDGSPVEDMSVEEMAVIYLKEIRRIQPKGPYYLGGYCFGGYLSLEIAHLLNAENEKVELMVMINSATHLFNNYEPGMTKIHRKLCALKDRFELEWSELSGQPVNKKMQRILMRMDRMYDLAQNKVEKLMDRLPDGFPLKIRKHSLVYHLEQIADANDRAWERYRPRPYDGKVVFLRAQNQPNGLIPDPLLGWKGYLAGELHVYEVPGFRQTMLDEPNVSKLAEIILNHLP